MTVADGKFSIDVKFGGEPARTINVINQPVALAPKQMAVRRPGSYALARAQRRDGKMVNMETTTHDAVAIKFDGETYWDIYHLDGDSFSSFTSPG